MADARHRCKTLELTQTSKWAHLAVAVCALAAVGAWFYRRFRSPAFFQCPFNNPSGLLIKDDLLFSIDKAKKTARRHIHERQGRSSGRKIPQCRADRAGLGEEASGHGFELGAIYQHESASSARRQENVRELRAPSFIPLFEGENAWIIDGKSGSSTNILWLAC